MKIITKMEVQKKNKNRYNIFLNDQFGFSLNAETIVEFGLKIDQEPDEELIQKLKEEDSYKYAFELALNYISYRARTERETRDYLEKKELDAASIDHAILKLMEYKYLDDERYAWDFIKYQAANSQYGTKVIQYKLLQKGIRKEIVETVCEAYQEEYEQNLARQLVAKLNQRNAGLDPRKKRDKIYRALMTKGFDYDKIKPLLSHMEDEFEE